MTNPPPNKAQQAADVFVKRQQLKPLGSIIANESFLAGWQAATEELKKTCVVMTEEKFRLIVGKARETKLDEKPFKMPCRDRYMPMYALEELLTLARGEG